MKHDENDENAVKKINQSRQSSKLSSRLSSKNILKDDENCNENNLEYWQHFENLGYVLPENAETVK